MRAVFLDSPKMIRLVVLLCCLTFVGSTARADILALIDVETTGLDPDTHEMIDIGAIYIDREGRELGRFFARMQPLHPERADAGAQAVNGFSVERWQSLNAVTPAQAARDFEAFHKQVARDRKVIFTAFNVWFDQAFVSRWLARHGRSFRDWYHYQVLDLPSMAWARGQRGLTGAEIAAALGIAAETRDPLLHTGESGAQFNLEVYRKLLEAQ
jgi:DNA polymerase III epsilon subunit-like protein